VRNPLHPARRRAALVAALGAPALVVAHPSQASANILTPLPQNTDRPEQGFSPAYDGDGCYATAAIGARRHHQPRRQPDPALKDRVKLT
jgi:hypothetical protein